MKKIDLRRWPTGPQRRRRRSNAETKTKGDALSDIDDFSVLTFRALSIYSTALASRLRRSEHTPTSLSRALGRDDGYIHFVLGGGVLLTLSTIAKIDAILGTRILRNPSSCLPPE